MFEDMTYEQLLDDVLDNAPDGIDTRQGSIFYDAVSGILLKVAELYTNLDLILNLVYIDTATGDYLDKRAEEYGIERDEAVAACYYVTFDGTTPDVGERFYANDLYFTLQQDDDGTYYLECEEAGTNGNGIYSGTAAIPVDTIEGLNSATFGVVYITGSDAESDDSLRLRIQEKISGPAENGNKQQYKYWCESVDGVGRARIFPLWNGPNTVKGVLIDTSGYPSEDSVVEAVQEYIDPATQGCTAEVGDTTYTVGDGLGEGVANLGAHFTAVAAKECSISVSFTATELNGTVDEVTSEATTAIKEYLQELVMESMSDESIVVRITSLSSILSNLDSLVDFEDLKINDDDKNVTPDDDSVPILEEVTVNVNADEV